MDSARGLQNRDVGGPVGLAQRGRNDHELVFDREAEVVHADLCVPGIFFFGRAQTLRRRPAVSTSR